MVITKGLSQINSIIGWNILRKLVWLQGPEENCLLAPDTLQSRTARQIVQKGLPTKTTFIDSAFIEFYCFMYFLFLVLFYEWQYKKLTLFCVKPSSPAN